MAIIEIQSVSKRFSRRSPMMPWRRSEETRALDDVSLTIEAGTVAVMNAHMWHGGTANRTSTSRLAMHGFYCRRDKPQQQYQKKLLRPDVQASLTPQLRDILALDDPLNDELSAGVIVTSGFLK